MSVTNVDLFSYTNVDLFSYTNVNMYVGYECRLVFLYECCFHIRMSTCFLATSRLLLFSSDFAIIEDLHYWLIFKLAPELQISVKAKYLLERLKSKLFFDIFISKLL